MTAATILEVENGRPIKLWTEGVPVEDEAKRQLINTARLPFIFKHLAVMPDVHLGKGSTIGSVIPTVGAVIPAAVGVDIGCGMIAARCGLSAADLPDNLHGLRGAIERAVPHGKTFGRRDAGAWHDVPAEADRAWAGLAERFARITAKYPRLARTNHRNHLGTLGGGNAIGNLFIELAQADMRQHLANLPDRDLAYFAEGSRHFDDYIEAVDWAQDFARRNRAVMMEAVIAAAQRSLGRPFAATVEAVNCHHNYVQKERHFGREVLVTRKGAVSARRGELGIIPGSMGAKSYIVRGLGNEEAFCSCSHGAGRLMSRTEARRRFTVADQARTTAGVECRKDEAVIDEIPLAYKDIDRVMAAQRSLVEVVHTLRQVVCVKG